MLKCIVNLNYSGNCRTWCHSAQWLKFNCVCVKLTAQSETIDTKANTWFLIGLYAVNKCVLAVTTTYIIGTEHSSSFLCFIISQFYIVKGYLIHILIFIMLQRKTHSNYQKTYSAQIVLHLHFMLSYIVDVYSYCTYRIAYL